ncbi:MAG: adenylate/guanylate cyclase domain-containing protein, partial [Acidimicrobiia bacterium]
VRTAALSINQLRLSGLESETFVARARTLNTASTFTLAEVQVEDAMGRAVAHATGSFLIRPIDPPPPPWSGASEPIAEPVYPTPDPPLRRLVEEFPFRIWHEQDGLSVMRRYVAGELPQVPVFSLLGLRCIEADEGVCAWVLRASEWLCSRSREVAPGVLALVPAGSVITLAPAGHGVGIVEQSVTLLRPVLPDGLEVLTRGTVVHQAGDLVVSAVEVTDADGNRAALGYVTAVIRKRRSRASATEPERVMATVLFTDIVGSTERIGELGDARWNELLGEHHALVRKQLQVFKGHEVKTTGDGFLATFDSPGRAVQCARVIRDGVRRLGLEVRAGLHTGECEVSGADVAGIAIHLASRVQSLAAPGEILVSGTVHDLVTGSGLRFADRGRHQLKGIEGEWPLFAVVG